MVQSHPSNRPDDAVAELGARGIDVVRVSYADLLGTERSREILVDTLPDAVAHGLTFCRAVFHTTTTGDTVPVAGGLEAGLPDIKVVPDLCTMVDVPWDAGVATCLGDVYEPSGGLCCEAPRSVLRRVVTDVEAAGLHAVVGPELEYYLLERDPAHPQRWRPYDDVPGNVYVSGRRGDPDGHLTATLRQLRDLGLGVTAANHEFSPGQFEINLGHCDVIGAADHAFRFRAAIKELARRNGRSASFMAKPLNGEGGSGFHVHVSLVDPHGRNVGDAADEPYGLSATLRHALAGVLKHAAAISAFANPTVNSYKRFGPDTLAPWLIDWGLDNRSAMVRIPAERGAATRVEVRLPDASANPYLLFAALLAAMQLGIEDGVEPPEPLTGYGYDPVRAAPLPRELSAALDALGVDTELTHRVGKPIVETFLRLKRDEVERYRSWVSDWELREYGEHI